MRVIMTSFNYRSLANWLPLADEIRRRDGVCDFALFPRESDPDHRGLLKLKSHVVFSESIDEDFKFIRINENNALSEVAKISGSYDAILMTSCILGPELKIRAAIGGKNKRPSVVGLQHGFFQLWDAYEKNSHCFDLFGVFGKDFVNKFSERFRHQVIPLALPKLDLIQQRQQEKKNRVLFILQSWVALEAVESIVKGMGENGYDVQLRSHPEHRMIYEDLHSRGVRFSDPEIPLQNQILDFDYVITSGSTAALEALEARIPTAIIPAQYGDEYQKFGIVAKDFTADSIRSVLTSFESSRIWPAIDAQLSNCTGPRGSRASFAYTQLKRKLRAPSIWQRLLSTM